MDKQVARQKAEKLRKLIDHHRYLYHVLDKQEISEEVLDSLKKELFDIEEKYPDLITPFSPTQRIGGKPLTKFNKISRKTPMLSLNDAFSEQDMHDWLKRIEKIADQKLDFFCELKIDGLAFELIYSKGFLKTGSTRGDGVTGEDVTENLKTINSIPLELRIDADSLKKINLDSQKIKEAVSKQEIVVRGEAFINKKTFDKINKEREKENLDLYANPRNVAAGSIRQLDPRTAASRKMDSFAYDLVTDLGIETHQKKHELLRSLGFKVNSHEKACSGIDQVFSFYQKTVSLRNELPYEIDGVVTTVNNNKVFSLLGSVGKAPRGAVAYKFALKQATTIVEDISIQVGRTGVLTPVALLKPVNLSGVMISRATLHNQDEIERLGLKIKDTVIVGRAGDVIPDVLEVITSLRTGKEKNFVFPDKCPSCGKLIKKVKKTATVFYCLNKECPARRKEFFSYFISRKGFNFEGLGEETVTKLIEKRVVDSPADLFFLTQEDFLKLEGFQEKSALNAFQAIKNKKRISLTRLIYSLGIENVGEETAFVLAQEFKNLTNLKKASLEKLIKIKDIGPITAEYIYHWFRDKNNLAFLERINQAGVTFFLEKTNKDQRFKNKNFVLTGTLGSMSREKAGQRIKELGGKVSQSVSTSTNFIVVGDNPGSKLKKAQKLGIEILKEEQFIGKTK
jgi:DNA ligase (NAD+)